MTQNPGIVSSEMLLQSSEHEKMDFVGREGTGEDADSQLKHYVAVVDPERKTWQIVEARRVTLRGAVRSRKPGEAEESDEEMVCILICLNLSRIHTDGGAEHAPRSTHSTHQYVRY